jgi:hypothetical protein
VLVQPGFDGSQARWNPVEHRRTAATVAHLAEVTVTPGSVHRVTAFAPVTDS